MNIIRLVARPLLAAPFVIAGLDAVTAPENHRSRVFKLIGLVEKTGLKIELSNSAIDTATQATGAVMTLSGGLLAFGKAPRTSAGMLALIQAPLALANNPFWERSGAARREALVGLASAAGLVGGAMIAATDRVGKPSIGWLAQRKATEVADVVTDAASSARAQISSTASKLGVA